MAKGWTHFASINEATTPDKRTVIKNEQGFSKLIKNTKKLSVLDLKKESENLFDKQVAEDDKLLDAFVNKRLKSKAAIKKALKLKKLKKLKNAEEKETDD